ncbi:hypothetical protein V7x_40620 [Crateriforma conspicua]|uniref:Prepilin-type N-terminal cleavage/methylation domain-containing protein n=1 Tax=Crateriforma conspicua TaxID=2527996 RepID=A0A5C6FPK1_9PLAN|nr:prepilin-type N-terminal cleavage/methylation domain-containing protein [Crateriforma conspicua]TWU62333.1 hypothetical protein V7x_40620 [Crateriforma conspicua]
MKKPRIHIENPPAAIPIRGGLTLVELVVAIALSAALLAALTGVLRGVSQQVSVAKSKMGMTWPARTMEILRRDLMSANAIWQERDVVFIRGDHPIYIGSVVDDVAADVGYRCRSVKEGVGMLVRRHGEFEQVLAIGPIQLRIERIDGEGESQPLPAIPGPVPGSVRVWIWQGDREQPLHVQSLVLR